MSEPLIRFDGVWKKFRRGEHHDSLRDLVPALARRVLRRRVQPALDSDEFWVLKDLSFEVRAGEVLGIIGRNGAGKSTTLKLLTKLLRPTRGASLVEGRVGALIEVAAGFHPDLTGRENVFLQGAILGMSRADIVRRFDEIVAFSEIEDFIDTPVKRYSSGMNARLGFSIAAHLDPEVLLIDEVLAVGDFSFQQKCFERLRKFRRDGVPICFVSHNMQAVASLCDRVLFLRSRQPAILGAVDEVLSAYTAGGSAASDDRIRIASASLALAGQDAGQAQLDPVRPQTALTLRVLFEAAELLPQCVIGFEVVRNDGVVVFNGSPMLDGAPAVTLEPGALFEMRFDFVANLLRGTYTINVHVVDERRIWRPIAMERVGSFVVNENTRVAGFAELVPRFELVRVGSASLAVAGTAP
jgi:lipopolysaccharide transport system ATP-binding protein